MTSARWTVWILLGLSAMQAAASDLKLWYRQPASKWTEALPVGNGRLAAMVFGDPAKEHIQLNEDTVWSGEKRDRSNPQAPQAVREIRRLLQEGHPAEAQKLADRAMIAVPRALPVYQTLGDLRLDFGTPAAGDYRRELDLDNAIATVEYTASGVRHKRETFASAPGRAIVVRLTADKPGSISFRASVDRPADAVSEAAPDRLILTGQALPKTAPGERETGVRFRAEIKAILTGGKSQHSNGILEVKGADSVTLLIVAATDFRETDLAKACDRALSAIAARGYDSLKAEHIADHQRLFRRVSLTLPQDAALRQLPTDERLRRMQQGASDDDLIALYFQYGRYLLIGSSRPGSLASNLQGKWNDSLKPAWGSKYTININTQMNYWLAESANLSELHEPLFDLLDNAREDGRRIARFYYDAPGFMLHHNTDLWGHAVPIDGARWGIWPMGGAWLALHLADHYDFTRDRKFLAARAYPVMKEAAEFFLAYLMPDGKGHLVTGPSTSPENEYRLPSGEKAVLCLGPTMDTEILRALFGRLIEASETLGIDADFRKRIAETRAKLPPLSIGKHGQLQEWAEDYDETEPGHRHISHLFALFPGDRIIPHSTPDLARAARVTLDRRLANGGGHTGWSRAWIIAFWTRLGDAELAYDNMQALLRKSTLPNLFDNHPPFQIDGNFGAAAALVEMLVQSHAGEIHLLPALPRAWNQGSVTGLRARGGVGIDLAWTGGVLTSAALKPSTDGTHKLRLPDGVRVRSILDNGKAIRRPNPAALALKAGHAYTIQFERTGKP